MAFVGHAPTKAQALALAYQLGASEVHDGLWGEVIEVPDPKA